jgi:hypothetical protein
MRVRLTSLLIGLAALAAAACSSNGSEGTGTQGTGGGGSGAGAGGQASSSSNGATGGSSSQATSSSSDATSTSQSSSTGGAGDPFAAARIACMDKINALRSSKSLPAYGRWMDAEMCVDQQATADETSGKPHGAWLSGTYSCNGSGQNECLGAGPNGIEGCLQQMWDEKNQPDCSGCDACADAYDPNCPNCDFYGQKNGQVCGHYVNLSAKYFSEAACGFSSLGGWDAINFH